MQELTVLLRESLRVWHWQAAGEETVIFFTEAQSHTKMVWFALAEKTDLHRHCSFFEAEQD